MQRNYIPHCIKQLPELFSYCKAHAEFTTNVLVTGKRNLHETYIRYLIFEKHLIEVWKIA